MIIPIKTKDTLSAVECDHGDIIQFTLANGNTVDIEVKGTGAEIMSTTLETPKTEVSGAMTTIKFWADLSFNGEAHKLVREIGTQNSFYEPWEIAGIRLWLDAVDDVFDFMFETHAPCRTQANCHHHQPPHRQVRIALQDATLRICPETVHPWCPLPEGTLKIEDCYRGEDCWMGPYDGASAHGGLDINHPSGTPLYAPINLDNQFLYNSTALGSNNNRWRAMRRWDNGSDWILQTSHMNHLTIDEHTPLKAGQEYANGAGVWIGCHAHTHFGFIIIDRGELIRLDPWILFWQMYQDQGN